MMMTAATTKVSFIIQADSPGPQETSFKFAQGSGHWSREEMLCYLRKDFLFPYVFKLY